MERYDFLHHGPRDMNIDLDETSEEVPFSEKFTDDCFREMMKFIKEMEKKHDGLSYARLFQYNMAVHIVMLELYQEVEGEMTRDLDERLARDPVRDEKVGRKR